MYYKLWQVLQIRAIITNWGITNVQTVKNGLESNYCNSKTLKERLIDFLTSLERQFKDVMINPVLI